MAFASLVKGPLARYRAAVFATPAGANHVRSIALPMA